MRRLHSLAICGLAVLFIGGGVVLIQQSDARADAALVAHASAAVADRGGRVVAMRADASRYLACGWADLGGADGVVPVMAYSDVKDPKKGPLGLVVVPRLYQGDVEARVRAAYDKQLAMVSCETASLAPPRPSGVVTDGATDGPLRSLWMGQGGWAVIPAPLGPGFVGVRRRTGAGPQITPVLASREAAAGWARAAGP